MTLVYLLVAWLTGLIVSNLLHQQGLLGCSTPAWLFPLSCGSVILGLALTRTHRSYRLAAGLGLFFLLAAWRYHSQPFAPCLTATDLAYHHEGRNKAVYASIEGTIADYPDVRDQRVQYRLRSERLVLDESEQIVKGDVLVEGPRFPVYSYGDRILARGLLLTPSQIEGFDYERYLAQSGVHSLLRRAHIQLIEAGRGDSLRGQLYANRTRLSLLLNRLLPEPAAGLANGMLLGLESGISDEVDEAFRATGASHVIVISGSNIALFSGLLMAWATRAIGRRRAALPVIVTIAAYVILIGADAAAFRAGIMGGLVVLAAFFGRRNTGYVSLCAAGLVLTAINPLSLWDLGFQLSFLATLGLILFTGPLAGAFDGLLDRIFSGVRSNQASDLLRETLIVTFAAQIMTAPLLLTSFGRFSPVSLLVNALIVPAQPPILIGGFAALATGMVWEPLGRLAALIPWLFLQYTAGIVRAGAALPYSSIEVGSNGSAWALIAVASTIAVAASWMWRHR